MNIIKQEVNTNCSHPKDRISLTVFLRNEKIYRRNNEASSKQLVFFTFFLLKVY